MIIFRYALIRGVRAPLSLIVNCVMPLILVLIRPLWADDAVLGFGFIAFMIMSGAYLMSQSIITDKTDGAIYRILAAPVTMRRYLAENLLACMVPLTVQMILISLLGFMLYDWSPAIAFGVFLCYTLLTLASVSMSFAWHCLFKSKENSGAGFGFVLTFMAMLSGMLFPTTVFPGPLQYIGAIFPIYWAMQGLNSVLELGAMSMQYWLALAAMLLFTAAFLLYGGKRRII